MLYRKIGGKHFSYGLVLAKLFKEIFSYLVTSIFCPQESVVSESFSDKYSPCNKECRPQSILLPISEEILSLANPILQFVPG